jgi:hypothetical protein
LSVDGGTSAISIGGGRKYIGIELDANSGAARVHSGAPHTYGDAGLYSDDTEAPMARVVLGVRRWSDMPIEIEIEEKKI